MEIRDMLSPELVERLNEGIQQAHEGRTHDLGDFTQYLDDEDDAPVQPQVG